MFECDCFRRRVIQDVMSVKPKHLGITNRTYRRGRMRINGCDELEW